ncbi:MAG: hypothetical protein LBD97_10165, partial [Bifidobacteriaceae bacterium]|nr:hypothetical protein [Bifidobacteriaceae bacterium]
SRLWREKCRNGDANPDGLPPARNQRTALTCGNTARAGSGSTRAPWRGARNSTLLVSGGRSVGMVKPVPMDGQRAETRTSR